MVGSTQTIQSLLPAPKDSTPVLSGSATQAEINYFNEVLPYALVEQQRTGIPAEVMIVQSGNETGWGTSWWWKNANNPAGIGVTGASGVGQRFATPQAGWDAYANDLLGIGESGQSSFAADLKAGAPSARLVQDIEASPWAAGHYGWSPGKQGALDQSLLQMFGGGTQTGTVGADTTSISGDIGGAIGNAVGGGVAGDVLGAFFGVFGGVKNAILLGAQAFAGLAFIVLGVIIILVDTKSVQKVGGTAAMVAAVAA